MKDGWYYDTHDGSFDIRIAFIRDNTIAWLSPDKGLSLPTNALFYDVQSSHRGLIACTKLCLKLHKCV